MKRQVFRFGFLGERARGRDCRAATRPVLAAVLAFLGAGGSGFFSACAETQPDPALGARIDWAKGEIRVSVTVPAPAKVKPDRLRALALGQAQANLKKVLANTVPPKGAAWAVPPDSASQLVIVRAARVISAGPVSGGRYSLVLQAKLPAASEPGELTEDTGPEVRYTDPDPATVRTFPALPPPLEPDLLTPADASGPFTGLIVDTRGLGVRNAMSPRLLDAALREVYSGAHASVDYVEEVGVVGYMGTIAAALKNPRVGARPLVVRAVGVADVHNTFPVISCEDARRFLTDRGARKIIGTCAVCFVIDSLSARDNPPGAPSRTDGQPP